MSGATADKRLLEDCSDSATATLQGSIDVAGQAITQQAIGAGAQKEDGDRQEAGIPEGQAGTDGARAHGLFRFEYIADAADRVEQLWLAIGIDFLAEIIDIHIDDIGRRVEGVIHTVQQSWCGSAHAQGSA